MITLKQFNDMQIHEIDVHKWIESEKAGRDLGTSAVLDWIRRYARAFRNKYSGEIT